MRRNRNRILTGLDRPSADPGKDLFAYLFILIMVFSFMLLMTTEERQARMRGQKAPQSSTVGRSQLTKVAIENLGELRRFGGEIFLVFANRRYHPLRDLEKLEHDGRVTVIPRADGGSDKTLYLVSKNAQRVSLAEYLEAFSFLGEHGINVAFADEVQ